MVAMSLGMASLLWMAGAAAQQPPSADPFSLGCDADLHQVSSPSEIPLQILIVRERTRNGPEAVAPDMGFNVHVGSEGIPTEVDIVKSSGNRDVDKAARAWVYGFRYNAANCVRRTGYLPLVL